MSCAIKVGFMTDSSRAFRLLETQVSECECHKTAQGGLLTDAPRTSSIINCGNCASSCGVPAPGIFTNDRNTALLYLKPLEGCADGFIAQE